MKRVLKALGVAGASVSMMMCNLEDASDDGSLLVDEAELAAAAEAPEPVPCFPVSTQQVSGVNDNFAAGPVENPTPRAAVLNWISSVYSVAGVRSYDATHGNQYFAHSFSVTPPTAQHYLSGAVLLGRLRCLGSNDALYIGFINAITGLNPQPYWGGQISGSPISGACGPLAAPLAFTYNLASLPVTAQNLVPTISSNAFVDVLMQDDSAMDFLTLRMEWSCKVHPLP